jgi:hypothetical protein
MAKNRACLPAISHRPNLGGDDLPGLYYGASPERIFDIQERYREECQGSPPDGSLPENENPPIPEKTKRVSIKTGCKNTKNECFSTTF